jgi:hypothetical protein
MELDHQATDHWHVYWRGRDWISYSWHPGSTTAQDEPYLSLVKIDKSFAVVGQVTVIAEPVDDGGTTYLPDGEVTNDHPVGPPTSPHGIHPPGL